MRIIKAKESDLSNIMLLISKTVETMIQEKNYQWDKSYPDVDIIADDINNNSLYIIKNEENYLGTITINEDQSPEYVDVNWLTSGKKTLIIHRLAIHPSAQRQGIAKNLINFAEEYARKNNYTSIRLDTFSENQKALSLYDKCGYKRTGKVYFSHRTTPFTCFEKIL
ncbi:GNAT family N-acetyltransferase [Clostridium ganghwense]|uniref:GNAT family N-acetyltransferase n=1 Tax=Clostridium ganghwense TaxID=312089 RepID=A0ABT4CJ26_9CLOT|nr:GNAT family N-acetyltransferase [Clostridium ganghwense]MCY6369051.1 GNAT family N-acetyltransferase [Clostridium ganghwense]